MGFAEIYHFYMVENADRRTNNWFLVGSPIPLTIILLSYLYIVVKVGPRYMENKKPYSCKTFINLYNIFQIVANAWIVYALLDAGWFTKISLGCEVVDYSSDPTAIKLASIMWWTYMLKLVDLIETVVFVLRKKNRQISVLHLYHHVSTILIIWGSTKYIAGGGATFSILLNNTVHVIMYSYYFLSSQGPIMQKLTNPVKPYITIIQMVQFVMLLMHTSQSFTSYCQVSRVPGIIFTANLLVNFYLFFDFYQKNYVKSKTLKNLKQT